MQTTIEITGNQLAIDWTLTESDIQFINKTANQSIKFAALLCHLRAYGRFISKDDTVPFIALSYLAKQLEQSLSVTPVFYTNSHSYIQQEKIRNYFGYTEFNEDTMLETASACEAIDKLTSYGVTDHIVNRFAYVRKFSKRFLNLKLGAGIGLTSLSDFDTLLETLQGGYHRVATNASKSLSTNDFVTINEGKFCFTKEDALVIPSEAIKLRKLIQSRMPAIRIEKLLAEAAKMSDCMEGFTPFYAHTQPIKFPLKPLLAAILAHATNIGLFGMGSSAVGISIDALTNASHVYLRQDSIKEVNRRLINHLLTYPISEEMTNGSYSSSDGERYPIERKFFLSSFYPKYYGYYERAISIYTEDI